jgi:hypothetical protein
LGRLRLRGPRGAQDYGGSPHWLLDHHQRVPCVLHNRCGRRYHRVKVTASNGASGNGWFQENPSVALLFDRRLLQQNLPWDAITVTLAERREANESSCRRLRGSDRKNFRLSA